MTSEFPVQFSQRTISGQAGAVRANLDVDTGSQMIGRAASQLGGTIFDLGMKIQETRNKVDLSTKQREVDEKSNALLVTLETTYDKETRDKLVSQWESDIDKVQGKNEWVNTELQTYKDRVMPDWQRTFTIKGLAIEKDNAIADIQINADAYIKSDDVDSALKQADLLREVGVEQTKINAYKSKLQIQSVENKVAKLKGLRKFDEARDIIQSSAILDPEQAQAMLANIDSYELTLKRREEAERFTDNMNSYKDFGERMADPTKEPVTYDDVELANFAKDQEGDDTKEKWIGYNGYLKRLGTPPMQTSVSGQVAISNIVIGIPTSQMGKQEAYDMLLDQFVDGNISREDFNNAWEKVNKPYPRTFAESLKSVMDSKSEEIRKAEDSWIYTKAEQARVLARSQKVNAELIRWADTYFQQNGKYPETALLYEERAVKDAIEPPIDTADSLDMILAPDLSLDIYWDDIPEVERREIYKALESDPNNITEILRVLKQ